MSTLGDVWHAITTIATAIDRFERQDREIETLRTARRDLEIRLVKVETILRMVEARGGLPPGLLGPRPSGG